MKQRPTTNLDAYDFYHRGYSYFSQASIESNTRARELFERALALDPGFAVACGMLAMTFIMEWAQGWSQTPETKQRALKLAEKAVGGEFQFVARNQRFGRVDPEVILP